jgi:hypothetical protein
LANRRDPWKDRAEGRLSRPGAVRAARSVLRDSTAPALVPSNGFAVDENNVSESLGGQPPLLDGLMNRRSRNTECVGGLRDAHHRTIHGNAAALAFEVAGPAWERKGEVSVKTSNASACPGSRAPQ